MNIHKNYPQNTYHKYSWPHYLRFCFHVTGLRFVLNHIYSIQAPFVMLYKRVLGCSVRSNNILFAHIKRGDVDLDLPRNSILSFEKNGLLFLGVRTMTTIHPYSNRAIGLLLPTILDQKNAFIPKDKIRGFNCKTFSIRDPQGLMSNLYKVTIQTDMAKVVVYIPFSGPDYQPKNFINFKTILERFQE